MSMIALDSECTGVDMVHGALPYFVTIYDESGEHTNYDWAVDPYTRKPTIPQSDVEEIKHLVQIQKNWGEDKYSKDISNRHTLILQNCKFDITALSHVDPWFRTNWPWKQTRDTIIAGHLLDSGTPVGHGLTGLVEIYLDENIKPYEDRMEKATQWCRRYARRKFPDWEIAAEGQESMPSAKASKSAKSDGLWKADMWLPKLMVSELGYDKLASELDNPDHNYDTLLRDYANADSFFTYHLWQAMETLLHERDLWEIFESRMKLLPVAFKMEHRGVTLSKKRLLKLQDEYEKETDKCETICVNIASNFKDDDNQPIELKLPKSGNNKQLTDLIFNRMKLPISKTTKETKNGGGGNPSLDAEVLDDYVLSLPHKSQELLFIKNLVAMRKRKTALNYIEGYQRHWVPLKGGDDEEWYKLHSNLNPVGTAHLRWSCSNPNNTNISKKENFNLRQMFGPAEGREWWSLDAQNIELRIPAFEAGEKDLIEVFLNPTKAPYYGSYHLVVFDTLHPELFRKHGKACKDLFEATWYQWVKNFNFALIYGCQEKKGDATAHVKGAFQKIRYRFPKIAQLADKQIEIANRTNGIETIPDKTVNPRRGYPIKCSFGNYGKVRPTLPLNYHTSGTAMQWTGKGMIRCDEKLTEWEQSGFDGFITLQVHDEMVFDFPKSKVCPIEENTKIKNGEIIPRFKALQSNLWRVRILQKLMEEGGNDIGIPTPVGVELNQYSWDKNIAL